MILFVQIKQSVLLVDGLWAGDSPGMTRRRALASFLHTFKGQTPGLTSREARAVLRIAPHPTAAATPSHITRASSRWAAASGCLVSSASTTTM